MIRGGAGLVYETMNWEALLAFNNAFGLNNVPTGAIIDAAGDTAGGTITASNSGDPARHAAMGQRCSDLWEQRKHRDAKLLFESLPHHECGPQHHYSLRVELDAQPATCVYSEPFFRSCLRRQSRREISRVFGISISRQWARAGQLRAPVLVHSAPAWPALLPTTIALLTAGMR